MFGSRKIRLGLLAVVAAAAVACGDGVLADHDDVVYLTPFNHDSVQPDRLEGPPLVFAPQYQRNYDREQAQHNELIREFTNRYSQVLQRPGVEGVLGAFEQSFISNGQYLELVALYQNHYQEYGVESVAGPALGWAMVKLGNEPAALALIEEMKEVRPNDPETWVVVGKYHARRAGESTEHARQARDAWQRVRQLDPDFEGFKSMDPARLDQELEALQRMIPAGPVADDPLAEADAPMHHDDGQPAGQKPSDVDDGIDDRADADAEAARVAEDIEDEPADIADEQVMAPDEYVRDAFPEDLPPEKVARLIEQREQADAQPGDEEGEDPADEPDEVAQADDGPSVGQLLIRGRRALQRGGDENMRAAQNYFEQALEKQPENMEAGIGLLRVAERTGAPDEMLGEQIDTLSEHEMTARQAYELGLFSLNRLNDPDRATSLLERVEQLDPSFARRVGVDTLLESR